MRFRFRFVLTSVSCFIALMFISTTATNASNRAPYVSLSSDYGYSEIVVDRGTKVYFSGYGYDRDSNGTRNLYFTWKLNGVTQRTQYGQNANFNHTFTPPAGVEEQSYEVKLSGRDNEGSTVTKTITIIVKGFDRQYYLTDHLGSIRTTVDGSGMKKGSVSSWDDYYPLGLPMPNRSFNATNTHALNKFTGHEMDVQNDINLTYAGARYLDPEIGQWLSVDPLAAKFPEWSPYNYTMGNPMLYTDPDGRAPWIGALVGAAVDYGAQVSLNLANGKTGADAFYNDVDFWDVAISAGSGALTGGLDKIDKIGKLTKVISTGLINATDGVAKDASNGKSFDGGGYATDFFLGSIGKFANDGLNKMGKKVAQNPQLTTQKGLNLHFGAQVRGASNEIKKEASEYGTGEVAQTATSTISESGKATVKKVLDEK